MPQGVGVRFSPGVPIAMLTYRKKLEATLHWKTIDNDWFDYYGGEVLAGAEMALCAVRYIGDTGIPEQTIVAIGEHNLDRFLTEHEWAWPQPVEMFLHWKHKAQREIPPGRPQIPAFKKIKKSELLENRRK